MIQNHVTNLEISKQLKEAGVPQEGLLYWVNYIDSDYVDPSGERVYTALSVVCDKKDLNKLIRRKYARIEDVYRTFLASELMEMLPSEVDTDFKLNVSKNAFGEYQVYYKQPIFIYGRVFTDVVLADALAQMVLYLVEKKIINF